MTGIERQCSVNTCRLVADATEMVQFFWSGSPGTFYLCARCVAAFNAFIAMRFDEPIIDPLEEQIVDTLNLLPPLHGHQYNFSSPAAADVAASREITVRIEPPLGTTNINFSDMAGRPLPNGPETPVPSPEGY